MVTPGARSRSSVHKRGAALQGHAGGGQEDPGGPQRFARPGRVDRYSTAACTPTSRRRRRPAQEAPDQRDGAGHVEPVARAGWPAARRCAARRPAAGPGTRRGRARCGVIVTAIMPVPCMVMNCRYAWGDRMSWSGLGQLGAHGQRDGAVEEEQDQGGADGQQADPLVVGGEQPLGQAVADLLGRRGIGRGVCLGRHLVAPAGCAAPGSQEPAERGGGLGLQVEVHLVVVEAAQLRRSGRSSGRRAESVTVRLLTWPG